MVTPEALERVDILYGPFSAIHAGNSIAPRGETSDARALEWGPA